MPKPRSSSPSSPPASPPPSWLSGSGPQLFIVYLNLAMYAFCYQMQQPVLPATVASLVVGDDSSAAWASLQSWFGIMQLFGGLVSGVLADRFGAKSLLLLSFGSSAACYIMQAKATDLTMLYISQVPTLFQHAFMGATAFITAKTPPAERAHMLGFNGVAYGVGMLFGPALGGYLGRVDPETGTADLTTGAWIAFWGSVISCVLILVFLDDSKAGGGQAEAGAAKSKGGEVFSLKECAAVVTMPSVQCLVLVKTCGAMATGIWYAQFSGSIAKEEFGMDTQTLGLVTSYTAALSMMVQLSGFVKFASKFGDRAVNIFTAVLLAAAFASAPVVAGFTKGASSCAGIPIPLMLLFVPLTVAFMLLRSVSTAAFTNVVKSHQSGTVLGIDMGVGSAVRIVNPQIAQIAMTGYGFQGLAGLCAGLCLLMSGLSALTMASPTVAERAATKKAEIKALESAVAAKKDELAALQGKKTN